MEQSTTFAAVTFNKISGSSAASIHAFGVKLYLSFQCSSLSLSDDR